LVGCLRYEFEGRNGFTGLGAGLWVFMTTDRGITNKLYVRLKCIRAVWPGVNSLKRDRIFVCVVWLESCADLILGL
jgi:hypothetical protein